LKELVGTKLNQYQLHEVLGEGGMAMVFRAVHLTTGQEVAVKVLKPAFGGGSSSVLKRFFAEAQTASQLNHPNIVRCIGQGQAVPEGKNTPYSGRSLYYLVLQYVPGGTLARKLRSKGPLPLSRVEKIICEVAKALDYAHSQRVIHRDIKPSNIMINSDGRYLVSDFGIARLLDATTRLTTTSTGFMGTALYASPEQINGKEVDSRSDVYSLGVVAYELLTGRLPFDESRYENVAALLYAISQNRPYPIRNLRPQIPTSVERVVMRALSKQREERFGSAGEFAQHLRRAIPADYLGSDQSGQSNPTPVILAPHRRSGPTIVPPVPSIIQPIGLKDWWPGLVAALVVILALFVILMALIINSGGGNLPKVSESPLPATPSFNLTAGKTGKLLVHPAPSDSINALVASFGCTEVPAQPILTPCKYQVMVVGLPNNVPSDSSASLNFFTLSLGDSKNAESYEVKFSTLVGDPQSKSTTLKTAQAVIVVGTLLDSNSTTPGLSGGTAAQTKTLNPALILTWRNLGLPAGSYNLWYGTDGSSNLPTGEVWLSANFDEGGLWSLTDDITRQKYSTKKTKNALVQGHWELNGNSYLFRVSKAYFDTNGTGEYFS
jgi:serine/threonine protein kinase